MPGSGVRVVRGSGRARGVLAALALSAVLLGACTVNVETPAPEGRTPANAGPSATSGSADPGPVRLTLAVYGPKPQVAAYRKLARVFSLATPGVQVEVQASANAARSRRQLDDEAARGESPDLFLAEQQDLPRLIAEGRVQPVNELLEQRQVNFGDGFQRDGLEAFSADSALQCMPHDVSPVVVYYNADLIDLSALVPEGQDRVIAEDGWGWDEFRAAAAQAAGGRNKGVYIEPSIDQVAPFVWSASGNVVDDTEEPTTLTLSEGDARAALEVVLRLVRDPRLTFTAEQLAGMDAVTRFEQGRLGMLLGGRELTPRLRAADGLDFDVLPLPRIGSTRTVTQMTGYCLSSDTEHPRAAADFLAYAVGNEGAAITTEPGYVLPSNLQVAHSPAFNQPGRMPANAFIFNEQVRRSVAEPFVASWPEVSRTTAPYLERLFYQPVIDLDGLLRAMDARSRPIFAAGTAP